MNDQEYEQEKQRCVVLFEEWRSILRLQAWQLTYSFYRGQHPRGESAAGGRCVMEVQGDWRYLQGSVDIYTGETKDLSDEDLLDCVIHELMHLHLTEISIEDENFRAHEERVVTQLTRVILEMRQRAMEEAASPVVTDVVPEAIVHSGDVSAPISC